jgi:hypothetical protein
MGKVPLIKGKMNVDNTAVGSTTVRLTRSAGRENQNAVTEKVTAESSVVATAVAFYRRRLLGYLLHPAGS